MVSALPTWAAEKPDALASLGEGQGQPLVAQGDANDRNAAADAPAAKGNRGKGMIRRGCGELDSPKDIDAFGWTVALVAVEALRDSRLCRVVPPRRPRHRCGIMTARLSFP